MSQWVSIYLEMSDVLTSTQIVISSDSLSGVVETDSGDGDLPVIAASDSGNSSRSDESLNASIPTNNDIEMTESPPVVPVAESTCSVDVGNSLYETVTLLSTKQKTSFPPTVPTSCLVDPALVSAFT